MEMLLERACHWASKGFGIKLGDDRVSILVFIELIIIFYVSIYQQIKFIENVHNLEKQ